MILISPKGPPEGKISPFPSARVVCFSAVAALGACAPPSSSPPPDREPAADVALVDCNAPIGGIAVDDGIVEAASGYDAELAALDLEALPQRIGVDDLSPLFVSFMAYALDEPRETFGPLDREELLQTPMGRAVLAGFATADADPYDLTFFRRGFHRFHACSRRLPTTRAGFFVLAGLDVDSADAAATDVVIPDGAVVIDDTQPKAPLRRRLWQPPNDADIFIAETLEVDGTVRETEIVWRNNRADGNLDFAVYDDGGAISGGSHFATRGGGTVTTAAPYTCLFCHVDEDQRFTVIHPD